MLDYNGRIAGVLINDGAFKYVVVSPSGGSVEVCGSGEFELDAASPEQFQPLLGCKCIYGINRSQYHRKRLYLADDLAASDPEQFLWELSHSSADAIGNYLYSLLKLQPTEKGIHIECLSINRRTFNAIGEVFERHHLTLDKMIFEPEAVRQCLKVLATGDRAVFLHVDNDVINMQMFRQGHLVGMEILRGASTDFSSSPEKITESIGVLLMATFGGRPLRRKVTLIVAGDAARQKVAEAMKSALPYEFNLLDLPFDRLQIAPCQLTEQQLHYYFSPLTLCYAYNKSQKCASSPEKNAVLSSGP